MVYVGNKARAEIVMHFYTVFQACDVFFCCCCCCSFRYFVIHAFVDVHAFLNKMW